MKTTIQKHISDPQALKDSLSQEFPDWTIKYSKFADQITMGKSLEQYKILINKNEVVIESSMNRSSSWYGIPSLLITIIIISIDNYLNTKKNLTNTLIWVCIAVLIIELGYYLLFSKKIEKRLGIIQERIKNLILTI